MRKIEILDCTLRDGGYVNDNEFGYDNIKQLFNNLIDSKNNNIILIYNGKCLKNLICN